MALGKKMILKWIFEPLKKFKILYDVSPVTYPAYEDTEVAECSRSASKLQDNPAKVGNEKELDIFEAQILINSNLQ